MSNKTLAYCSKRQCTTSHEFGTALEKVDYPMVLQPLESLSHGSRDHQFDPELGV